MRHFAPHLRNRPQTPVVGRVALDDLTELRRWFTARGFRLCPPCRERELFRLSRCPEHSPAIVLCQHGVIRISGGRVARHTFGRWLDRARAEGIAIAEVL
jgi:hypothetical protein